MGKSGGGGRAWFHVRELAKYPAAMPSSRSLTPSSPRRPSAPLLLVLLLLGAPSCAHPTPPPPPRSPSLAARPAAAPTVAAAPLELVPADVARAGVVATFVVPSLDRSLASGVALVREATPLPLDAGGVRDMLLAQAGLAPEVASHLDISAPIAGAVVLNGQGGAPLSAFSFTVRTPGDIPALLALLGRTISRRGDAIQIENTAGDRGWFMPRGTVVAFADTDEALVRAGSLALEARRQATDDLAILVYPEMVARAAGMSPDTALEMLRMGLEERAAARGAAMGPDASRQLRLFVSYLGDITSAELALDLDAAHGASVLARLRPRTGSKLEALARQTSTTLVDPGLRRSTVGKDDAGIVLTSAYGEALLEQLALVRGRLPGDPPRAALIAGRLLDALGAGLTGQVSAIGRLQPAWSSETVLPIRDAVAAGRIEGALLANDKDAMAAVVRAITQGGAEGSTEVKVTRVNREAVGKLKAIHATVVFALPARASAAARELLGAKGMDVFLAVLGGERLAVTVGKGARGRLVALAGAQPPAGGKGSSTGPASGTPAAARGQLATAEATAKATPTATDASASAAAVVSDAVAAAGARSLFFFFDLRQIVFLVAATGADARLRMLSSSLRSPMPIFGGASGDGKGQVFTLDLTIPSSCFSGIGAVVQAAMLTHN